MHLVRGLTALGGLVYVGIGLWCCIDPVGALADVGVAPFDVRGQVELRAMYGGLQLGMAGFLFWCAASAERARLGLLAATLSIGGLGVGRTVSFAVYQPDGWLMPLLCVVELSAIVLGSIGLWTTRDSSSSTAW